MNKLVIGGVIGAIVLGAVAVYFFNQSQNSNSNAQAPAAEVPITRPAVQAKPNTFSVMTAEERAVAEAEAKRAAEAAALASTTASTSASSTVEADDGEEI